MEFGQVYGNRLLWIGDERQGKTRADPSWRDTNVGFG